MRSLLLYIILFLACCQMVEAQRVLSTEEQRREQRAYILRDTLPVWVEALPSKINTHFSEYAGSIRPDSTFYFTSMRADTEEDYDQLFETSWYCNIYQSKLLPDGNFAPVEPLPSILNARNTFNSNYCFNKAGDKIIYSRCVKSSDGALQCALWQSHKTDKNWSKPKKLPVSINAPGSSNMQPFLVEEEEQNILYFVSNRAQSIGGYDIWYSLIKNDHYQPPINAGATINTEGNEVTPYYDVENRILYFSSDEHPGIGDYDIFYSEGALSQWGEISNMGVPFNSEYNDYYFSLGTDRRSGYLSSNRLHNGMEPGDTCCNDIFRFRWREQPKPPDTTLSPSILTKQKIDSLLPIALYFQNDYPDPRSTADTTSEDYVALYQKYRVDISQYVAEVGRGLTGAEQQEVSRALAQFMEDSVVSGYQRLQLLETYLRELLAAGDTITLTIRGYASPLHNSDYNRHLSMRRIVSLINHLHRAQEGFFIPYLTREMSGLSLRIDPQGATNHQFSTQEVRETVYGLQAAKDRKIVITR